MLKSGLFEIKSRVSRHQAPGIRLGGAALFVI
jgi:hypothetical protein